jgi:acyl carrier protein
MHCVDQAGRGTSLTEDVAHVCKLTDGRGFTIQNLRHLDAEQPLSAQLRKGFAREARFRVNRCRVDFGNVARRSRSSGQIALARSVYAKSTGYPMSLDCHIGTTQKPYNRVIMRGGPYWDNDLRADLLSLSDVRLTLKTYVKPAAYSVSCATRQYRPVTLREKHPVDPQTSEDVTGRLVAVVKVVLGSGSAPADPFPLDAQLSDLGVSSLKMVNLMLAVELEFDIAIAQSDITPENFHSLSSIEALVTRTLGQRR